MDGCAYETGAGSALDPSSGAGADPRQAFDELRPEGVLAIGTGDGMVVMVEGALGEVRYAVQGHAKAVHCVDVSPDGRLVASGSWDRSWKIFDATTGVEMMHVRGHDCECPCICGKDQHGRRVGRVDTDCPVAGHLAGIRTLAFSRCGKRLATGSWDAAVCLWDAATGEMLRQYLGHTKTIEDLSFSPLGDVLASGGDDGQVLFWAFDGVDAAQHPLSGNLHEIHGLHAMVKAVAFSSGGVFASAGSEGRVVVQDARTGEVVHNLAGHQAAVRPHLQTPNLIRGQV